MDKPVYLVEKEGGDEHDHDRVRPQMLLVEVIGEKGVHESVEEEIDADERTCAVGAEVL